MSCGLSDSGSGGIEVIAGDSTTSLLDLEPPQPSFFSRALGDGLMSAPLPHPPVIGGGLAHAVVVPDFCGFAQPPQPRQAQPCFSGKQSIAAVPTSTNKSNASTSSGVAAAAAAAAAAVASPRRIYDANRHGAAEGSATTQSAPTEGMIFVPGLTSAAAGCYVDPRRYKTRMCRNHMPEQGRPCPFRGCCFAHSEAELRRPDDKLTADDVERLREQQRHHDDQLQHRLRQQYQSAAAHLPMPLFPPFGAGGDAAAMLAAAAAAVLRAEPQGDSGALGGSDDSGSDECLPVCAGNEQSVSKSPQVSPAQRVRRGSGSPRAGQCAAAAAAAAADGACSGCEPRTPRFIHNPYNSSGFSPVKPALPS